MAQDNFHIMDNAFKQLSISTEGLSDEITHFKPKILNTIEFIRNKKKCADTNSIYEELSKSEATNIDKNTIHIIINELLTQKVILNKKSCYGNSFRRVNDLNFHTKETETTSQDPEESVDVQNYKKDFEVTSKDGFEDDQIDISISIGQVLEKHVTLVSAENGENSTISHVKTVSNNKKSLLQSDPSLCETTPSINQENMTPLCRGEKEFFRKEDPQISKLEAQIAALKSHLRCELISMNSKIETMSEFLDKKFKDSNNQNQNVTMLKENTNFLKSELKEKNLFVKTLMETQTAALESISGANQQNHTLSSNKTFSTETRQTRSHNDIKISEAHKSAKIQSNNKLPETQKTKNNNDNNNENGKFQNQQLQQNDAWTKVPFRNHHQRINNNNWNANATERNTVQDLQLSNSYQGLAFDYVDDTDFNLIPGEFPTPNSMGNNQVVKPKTHHRGQVAPNQHPENQHAFPRPKHVPGNYLYANATSGK